MHTTQTTQFATARDLRDYLNSCEDIDNARVIFFKPDDASGDGRGMYYWTQHVKHLSDRNRNWLIISHYALVFELTERGEWRVAQATHVEPIPSRQISSEAQ
jgi:hypothetical protein